MASPPPPPSLRDTTLPSSLLFISVGPACAPSSSPQASLPPSKVVIIYSDVYGFASGNHRTFADSLQSSLGPSYAVLLPDLFRGCPALRPWSFLGETLGGVSGFAAMLYRLKYYWTVETMLHGNIVEYLLPEISKLYPHALLSCVGFCYGGWLVAQSLSLLPSAFACGVGIHPSLNVEQLFGRTELGLAERIGSPCLLLPAGNDSLNIKPGGSCVKVMSSKRNVSEEQCVCSFETMKHGWVTRGCGKDDEGIRKEQARALGLCKDFIMEHMDGVQDDGAAKAS